MPGATIPPPHADEVQVARFSLKITAEQCGLDLEDPKIQKFIERQVAVKAQMMAENRWLSNMMHDPKGLAEFLEQRKAKEEA